MKEAKLESLSYDSLPERVIGGYQTPQFFDVRTECTGQAADHHIIVNAHYPKLVESARDAVALRFRTGDGTSKVIFIVNQSEGKATVVAASHTEPESHWRIAAAVAVVKAQCGWDGSDPFEVVVNCTLFMIHAHHDGESWRASWSCQG
jgi:hypothetical protein